MRILLQEKQTGLYLQGVQSWVRRSAEAMDFVSSTAAIDFCMNHHLHSMQLVLKFEEHPYDIVMPVQPTAEPASLSAGRAV
jgi:hypothetical protein